MPTEIVQGKSQHQDAQLDLGRVRSIVVEHSVLETFTSSQSAAVDVFGVQEHVAAVRPSSDRVPAATANLDHCAVDFAIRPCDDDDASYTLMGSAEKIPLARWVGRAGFSLVVGIVCYDGAPFIIATRCLPNRDGRSYTHTRLAQSFCRELPLRTTHPPPSCTLWYVVGR